MTLFGPDPEDLDDTTNFYQEVNGDHEILENAAMLDPQLFEEEHSTVAMLDVLQTNGVAPEVAANFAASIVRNKPRFQNLYSKMVTAQRFVAALTDKTPSFIEVYGQGRILEAAHGCRRNLNVRGLDALDLRTCKKDGTHWDFNLVSDRKFAREMVET